MELGKLGTVVQEMHEDPGETQPQERRQGNQSYGTKVVAYRYEKMKVIIVRDLKMRSTRSCVECVPFLSFSKLCLSL